MAKETKHTRYNAKQKRQECEVCGGGWTGPANQRTRHERTDKHLMAAMRRHREELRKAEQFVTFYTDGVVL